MAIDRRLLDLLCCPATRVPLRVLEAASLNLLNERIARGEVHRIDGSPQAQALAEALVTTDGRRVYRIDEGIPVLLAEEGIALEPGKAA